MEPLSPIPDHPDESEQDSRVGNKNIQTKSEYNAALDRAMWSLFVLVSRKLQISSASIKAGVSSLLDYNIFWDGSAQHEFLVAINNSTNQISKLIMLLSLVSRAQAGNLVLKPEPQMLQEIISLAYDQFQKGTVGFSLEMKLESGGRTVLVDYEYLLLALKLLFDILAENTSETVVFQLTAHSTANHWHVDITGDKSLLEPFSLMVKDHIIELLTLNTISPENRIKFFVIYQVFLQQNILPKTVEISDSRWMLRIQVPHASTYQ